MKRERLAPARGSKRDLGDVMETIEAAVRDLDFGSILLKVHEGEVVSIETSRKVLLGGPRPALR